MAAPAAADYCGVIDSGDVSPYGGPVTEIAVTDDPYMSAGRGAGLYAACIRMAVDASTRRTNKNSLQVTGFAGNQGMPEFQGEQCLVMIEIRAKIECRGVFRIKAAQHEQNHQSDTKF